MNLIIKRLSSITEGTKVEITFKDGSTFIGTVSDNDHTETLAIINEQEENFIFYDDVKSIKVLRADAAGQVAPTAPATPVASTTPAAPTQTAEEPITAKDRIPVSLPSAINSVSSKNQTAFSFSCDVAFKNPSDSAMDEAFKKIPASEKKTINRTYQSFKASIKNNDKNKCAKLVEKLADELLEEEENQNAAFSADAWLLVGFMATRCNDESAIRFYDYAGRYDLLAIIHYLNKQNDKAVAYACAAIATDCFLNNENEIFTVAANGSAELNDMSGLCSILRHDASKVLNAKLYEWIKHLFTVNNEPVSSGALGAAKVIGFLNSKYPSTGVSELMNDMIYSSDFDEEVDDAEEERISGKISSLSWENKSGTIVADQKTYTFEYKDVISSNLRTKIEVLQYKDFKTNPPEEYVTFEAENSKAFNIKESKIENNPLFESKTNPISVSSAYAEPSRTSAETNLRIGRSLMANTFDDNRFIKALSYFKAALQISEGSVGLQDFINCSLPAYNKTTNTAYLEDAYNTYTSYYKTTTGLSFNTTILDLLLKMDKKKEALNIVDNILADPKIPIETRLNYILHRANIFFNLAEAAEKENSEDYYKLYDSSKTTYLDWEQRYLERPEIRSKSGFRKMYHNTVLLNLAKCLLKINERDKAEELLKKVAAFDPSNEIVKSMYAELYPADSSFEEKQDAPPENDFDPYDEIFEIDEDDEPFAQVYAYEDVSGWPALNISEKSVVDYVMSLNSSSRIPHGLTYLKAASSLNYKLKPFYDIYSFAANNPIEDLDYSPSNVVTAFSNYTDSENEDFKRFAEAAAFLRSSFYHTKENDFFIISSQISNDMYQLLPPLKDVFSITDSFRGKTGKGMDLYADYRLSKSNEQGNSIEKAQKCAEEMYNRYFGRFFNENISQKRFKLTKALMFEKGRIIEQLLSCVKGNNKQLCLTLSEEISSKFIRSGATLAVNNIDISKIDAYIDEVWAEAGQNASIHERKSSQLMGSLRNNLKTPLRNTIEIFCIYYDAINQNSDSFISSNITLYKNVKEDLLSAMNALKVKCETLENLTPGQALGCHILRATAEEIIKRLDGTWTEKYRKYFFVDFLRSNNILLDENYVPELLSTLCDLPEFNVLYRIRNHIENADKTFAEHAEEIYSSVPAKHDFGTALKISEYLSFIGDDSWSLPAEHEEYDEQARVQLREYYDEFNINMCSAISMGQIKISDKFMNNIDEIAQFWYQYSVETSNYGFFLRLVEHCLNKIHKDAKEYEDILKKQLDNLFENKNFEQSLYDTISNHIESQFFTVAEEIMSRIAKDDYDSIGELPLITTDYINQFWAEFEQNFKIVSTSGTHLKRLVTTNVAAKDRRGGQALVDNWPSCSGVGSEQIKDLLVSLGWSEDISVKEAKISSFNDVFLAKENESIFNNRQYAHPISAFGTQSFETGFYVVCSFGHTTAERIIDFCRQIDHKNGNKIILFDHALNIPERRKLAKLMKQQFFANTYLFIDRVSLYYMANHYRGGGGDINNRTLMAISLPFSYFQPYTLGSSSAIAPEMFIGRKDELLSVESPSGANLIYGGRQLGKSALLKKAKLEIDNRNIGRIALFVDIKDRDYPSAAKEISRELSLEGVLKEEDITENWSDLAFKIKNSIRNNNISYLLLMLDEADCFIESCYSVNFQPITILKDIQESSNNHFKFVLAGLHNIIKFKREIALGKNSVITHLSEINIKPFDYPDASKLLTDPLGYLGFDFGEDPAVLLQILSPTNYFPGLVQFFCYKLVESMTNSNYAGYSESDTPNYKVKAEHINRVLADKDFIREIKRKFEITLRLGDGNHYFIIALLLAMLFAENESAEGYNEKDIIKMATDIGFDLLEIVSKDDLSSLLEELCDLNILKNVGSYYTFRTKNFRDLLGSKEKLLEDIFDMLES